MRVTRARTSRSAAPACAPAKPPPRMTTWGQLAPSFAGTVGRRVRKGSGRTMGRTPCAAERRSVRGWSPVGSLSACGRGEHRGEGLGTVPDPPRAGAEIVGRGRGAGSGPFEVPADGTHSARPGPRTGRGGATRTTWKAIPDGGRARTDRSARPVTGRSRSAPTAPADHHGDELLMTNRGRLCENACAQRANGV